MKNNIVEIRIEKVKNILNTLTKIYKDAKCTLNYNSPIELLIGAQLASQSTDERVNKVSEVLFKEYKTLSDFANADLEDLELKIKSVGLYKTKAKNIINMCKMLIEEFNSTIPDNIDDLVRLPGIGRKIANLVLGEIFQKPAVIVDTHTKRLSYRIGLSNSKTPAIVEKDLRECISPESQLLFCHILVFHGRNICSAKKPLCSICSISKYCDKNFY